MLFTALDTLYSLYPSIDYMLFELSKRMDESMYLFNYQKKKMKVTISFSLTSHIIFKFELILSFDLFNNVIERVFVSLKCMYFLTFCNRMKGVPKKPHNGKDRVIQRIKEASHKFIRSSHEMLSLRTSC
jgi:hypothetical protein